MKLVLEIKYGGLGDHLFYSHIPRIAKQTGIYQQVYISTKSVFRHNDYKELIWCLNPYIDGFVDEPGVYPEFTEVEDGMNLLDKVMLLIGIDDGKRFHEPEIYYSPKFVEKYHKNIYDPNFVSYVGDIGRKQVNLYIYSRMQFRLSQMKIRSEKALSIYFNRKFIETPSLKDFCDLIYSSKSFYCLTSGSATLAAALNKPVVAFYGIGQNRMFHHSKIHKYIEL